jgi:hypothetical protein
MQFSKNTSTRRQAGLLGITIKVTIFLVIIVSVVIMLGKIDFPSPNKEIEKIIPNEKIRIVK